MQLWHEWWKTIEQLRPAFSRLRTFLWFAVCVAGITLRTERRGITSIIRATGLQEKYYGNLLDMFHSSGADISKLTMLWTRAMVDLMPNVITENGRIVLVGDGIKVAKQGKKMPGVKLLHQDSDSNTKAEYIMGHSLQSISLLVHANESVLAVPLATRIHEGIVLSNRDRRTLLDKMIHLLNELTITQPFVFVADAYYGSHKMVTGLLAQGNHLISRTKSNAVAYLPPGDQDLKRRGRPRRYGEKMFLRSLLMDLDAMSEAPSPVYGEKDVTIYYRSIDLLWKPAGRVVRFVAVVHPVRGNCIFMSTDTSLSAMEIIRLYGLRFKIELAFKQAVHVLGSFAYHFWMKDMTPLKRRNGNQYLHKTSDKYREDVKRKINAYHVFIQAGNVAQGLLQMLAIRQPELVWRTFGSWLRTIRPGVAPSEWVVAMALRNTFTHFLAVSGKTHIFTKFFVDHQDPVRSKIFALAG